MLTIGFEVEIEMEGEVGVEVEGEGEVGVEVGVEGEVGVEVGVGVDIEVEVQIQRRKESGFCFTLRFNIMT